MPNRIGALLLLTLWRLTSVMLVQTAHVADEYWQSLEVAHYLAFGYGHLTWEWTAKIRSYIYPFLISILYRVLAIFSLDFTSFLIVLPRVFQAILVAYGDYRFYKWTKSKWMLFVLCLNWYWYYCATRTLINTVETACTIIALSMFPWKYSHAQSTRYLWIVGFLCMARPTAAIIWFPLCLYHICTSIEKKTTLLSRYAVICSTCFLISLLIDCYCYGTFVISPLNFFKANVLRNMGDLYGKQHQLWYIFVGLPVLLGLYYIPFLIAIWRIFKYYRYFHRETVMLIVIVWTLMIYSLLSHKEFRFILPLLPMLIYVSSACTYRLNIKISEFLRKAILILLVCSNVVPGFYFSLIHQRGTLDIMKILRNEISHSNISSTDTLILTPCHSTPLYSYLHVNASMRFLTCEPNFNNFTDYMDEADEFFANPRVWLNDNYINNKITILPNYVIIFDNIVDETNDFLYRYKLIATTFHTHFPQSNYGKSISLYKHVIYKE